MSRIDDAVSRILRVKFQMGLFEKPFADKSLSKLMGTSVRISIARLGKFIKFELMHTFVVRDRTSFQAFNTDVRSDLSLQ